MVEPKGEGLLNTNNDLRSENTNAAAEEAVRKDGVFAPSDNKRGWIVVLASFWANGTVFGIINTFGIMYVQMVDHYSKNDPEISLKTAFVGSTCIGLVFLLSYLSSILSDRFGIRRIAFSGSLLATTGLVASAFIQKLELLYLTYGFMLGIGSSMVYSHSLVILGHYFKRYLGLVNGIASFGSSAFTIGLTRALPAMLSNVEIKYCFLFLASLHFILMIFTLSWKEQITKGPQSEALSSSRQTDDNCYKRSKMLLKRYFNVTIWKSRAYVIWCFSFLVALFGYFVPFFHLPKYTADVFPGNDGSWLIFCLSITSAISRIVLGVVADLKSVNRIRMHQLALFILGITTSCIPFASSFWGLIAISLVMGVCDGAVVCLLGPIAFDIVGPVAASQAIGFLLCIISIPHALGPPLAGLLYDKMGHYRVAFHLAGAPPILGAILMFLIPRKSQTFLETPEHDEQGSELRMLGILKIATGSQWIAKEETDCLTKANGAAILEETCLVEEGEKLLTNDLKT